MNIDSHDDKAWRDTLLKVAAILCERQPDDAALATVCVAMRCGWYLPRRRLKVTGRTPLAAFPPI